VVVMTRGPELVLRDGARAGVPRLVLPAADYKERVHAAITRPVGVVLVSRFAHGAIGGHEVRHGIARAELGCHLDLRVQGRAGSAERRLRVAPATAIQVETRPESAPDAIDLLKVLLTGLEELQLRARQTGQRIARSRRSRAHPGVTRGGIGPRASRRTHEQYGQ